MFAYPTDMSYTIDFITISHCSITSINLELCTAQSCKVLQTLYGTVFENTKQLQSRRKELDELTITLTLWI